eukprot:scaffold113883_cov20-Tisochrysis_lutea.AAC.4
MVERGPTYLEADKISNQMWPAATPDEWRLWCRPMRMARRSDFTATGPVLRGSSSSSDSMPSRTAICACVRHQGSMMVLRVSSSNSSRACPAGPPICACMRHQGSMMVHTAGAWPRVDAAPLGASAPTWEVFHRII